MRAHLLVVNARGETLIDADVFDFEVHNVITWWTGGRRGAPSSHEHTVPLSDLSRIEVTPVRNHAELDASAATDPSQDTPLSWDANDDPV